MIEISKFFDIRIYIETDDFRYPHIVGEYKNDKAAFGLETPGSFCGCISGYAVYLIDAWIQQYRKDLIQNYEYVKSGQFDKVFKVRPLGE